MRRVSSTVWRIRRKLSLIHIYVVISHADGRLTRYAHNSKLLVKAGQHVEQGEPIALSGSTGRSTGPHVHFEIYINGSAVDPLKYISN